MYRKNFVLRRLLSIESRYERKTPLEHVLLRPGMYIGQVDAAPMDTYVFDAELGKMVKRRLNVSPGLLKIFDEVIVNAADNMQRDKTMTAISVTAGKTSGEMPTYDIAALQHHH